MLIQVAIRYIAPKIKRTKRIFIDAERDVSELQETIQTQFGIPIKEQIIRFTVKNFEVRIVAGFSLDFYEIGNNAFLQVSRLEVSTDEEEQGEENNAEDELMNENYIRRMETINRLRIAERATNFELQTIKEVEENEDEDDKQVAMLKKTFMDITKLKAVKEFQPFLQSLLTLDIISQMAVLENTDKVGWTGIHYAVLYNEEYVISELLKVFKKEILSLISEDGWSPIFLAVHNKHWNLFNLMLEFADQSHLELQTNKGSLLHYIFKHADFDIIEKIVLEKNIDPLKEDFSGKRAVDLLTSDKYEQIMLLLELRKLPTKPISIFGEVEKNSFFFGWSKRVLHLNAEARTLERYGSLKDYPFKPKEIIPLHGIDKMKFVGYAKDQNTDTNKNFVYDTRNQTIKTASLFKPKDNFMEFSYAGNKHEFRIVSIEQVQIWEASLSIAIEWAKYYDTFITKIKNPNIKEKALKIWKTINKDFEQFNLSKREDLKKLVAAQIKTEEVKKVTFNLPKVGLRDFDVLKLLGRGAFGKVYKVLHKKTKKIFAMKVLRKKNLIKEQQIKYSLIEKRILEQNNTNPFLLSLYFAFQTVENLYMVIDYCPNEDLSVLLNKQPDSCLDERVVKFYMAEIILAIEDLHRRNYIYRDLKPENILIDESGHLKLADFGLAAENIRSANDFAKSFCGSPIYISPEILKSKRSYKTSDYYTMGVVMYELLTGDPPFFNEDIDKLYGLIKKGSFNFPPQRNISESAKDLIRKLINTNPKTRLGAERGIVEIKEHEFFKDINWDKLSRKEIAPPIVFNAVVHNFTQKIPLKDNEYEEKNFHVNNLQGFDYVREDLIDGDDK
jgi:serine/threonine protein kinase